MAIIEENIQFRELRDETYLNGLNVLLSELQVEYKILTNKKVNIAKISTLYFRGQKGTFLVSISYLKS